MTPRPRHPRSRAATRLLAASLALLLASGAALAQGYRSSVVASGLDNPRGLAFGPDGGLYIAEAGLNAGSGPSTLVRGVASTYTETGALTRVLGGVQSRVLTGLPSIWGSDVSGPNGVAFGADGTRYLAIGAGIDPTVRATDLAPNGVRLGRLEASGPSALSVDVSAFEATRNPAGGPLDSNPWRVAPVAGGVLVTDAGANALLKVDAGTGAVSLVTTFPPLSVGGPGPTDPVPTGLAVGPDGAYYVGLLTGFPFAPGAAQVLRVTPDGASTPYAVDFTNITDIAFGADGSLYVLEYDHNGILVPGETGALIRVGTDGSRTTVFSDGLVAPTGLAIGADGAFYVSNHGNAAGLGEVLRIAPVPEPSTWAMLGLGLALLAGRRVATGRQAAARR